MSATSISERLHNQTGRDFTLAVFDAFKYLGFEVEDIEETQGTQSHSDLIVKAHLATSPYFAVLECTAVREGNQVDYTKLYQLGSNFPRYLTRYSKEYPSAYKMIVGRPSFSPDAKKLAEEIVLMTADTLGILLKWQERFYLSQDELERMFQIKGEASAADAGKSIGIYVVESKVCAWIYMSLIDDPTSKVIRRKRQWVSIDALSAMVKQWGWLLQDANVHDQLITRAINTLSSDVVRGLLIDGQKVMLSSLPFEKVVQNMGGLGEFFQEDLMKYVDKAAMLKQSSKT